MHRRAFLSASVAAAAMCWRAGPLRAAATPMTLRAAALTQQILPQEYAGATALMGFNGSVPGPELRLRQARPFEIAFQNGLDAATSVHWHGIRLENAMDGVPGLTQAAVPPGDQFTYRFTPPDAGTFWYHSHHMSFEQVARGLMGPLIVEETSPPDIDHDITALIADWRLTEQGQLTEDFGNMHDAAHAGRMGNFARAFLPDLTLKTGQRIRLRLINASVDRVIPLIVKGLSGRIVALDGMPLPSPRDWDQPVLAPAQRLDLIADVTGPVALEMGHRMGPYPLGEMPVAGAVPARDAPIPALPANPVPAPGDAVRILTLTMRGGAMGGAHGGDGIWSFNDVSGMTETPFARIARGESAIIRLVNETRWPHGIHLHGHHFYELEADGTRADLRDTTLVAQGETRDILCHFDNPGKWMLHCHMLSHATGGMRSWVEVA